MAVMVPVVRSIIAAYDQLPAVKSKKFIKAWSIHSFLISQNKLKMS